MGTIVGVFVEIAVGFSTGLGVYVKEIIFACVKRAATVAVVGPIPGGKVNGVCVAVAVKIGIGVVSFDSSLEFKGINAVPRENIEKAIQPIAITPKNTRLPNTPINFQFA